MIARHPGGFAPNKTKTALFIATAAACACIARPAVASGEEP